MDNHETQRLISRLRHDLDYLAKSERVISTSIRLTAWWEGAEAAACIVGRYDIGEACRNAAKWIDATAAHMRGSRWMV